MMTKKEAEMIIKAASKVIHNQDTLIELSAVLARAVLEVK